MTRFILTASALAAILAVSPALADSVNAGSVNGAAAVTIYTPLTVVQNTGLDFGAITSGASGAVAIAPANGARTINGGVGALAVSTGRAAAFTVSGQSNAAINVVVAPSMTGFSGGITGATATGTLPSVLAGSSAAFSVGGTLTIPANTPAGAYTGAYVVSVNYP